MSAPIAPAPTNSSDTAGASGYSSHPSMAFSCQTCARRKVKCDKSTPLCSSCRKGRLECIYEAPAPRARKRKPGEAVADDVYERLAWYERVLRRHGLLEAAGASPAAEKDEEAVEDPIFPLWNLPSGKLVVGQGKSRYVNSHLWRNLGDDEMERMGDEHAAHRDDDDDAADEEDGALGIVEGPASDPLTGAFLGGQHRDLLKHHPTHAEAMILWATYVDNVEPILKVLHVPSMAKTIDTISKQPGQANKADESLVFAVYHVAIVSMSDEECLQKLGSTSREVLLQRYNLATRQALVNASFLSTTAMTVLQALVLYLVCCRNEYDPHTFWILTGVASRIAQRMGLHRDGEVQGLSPFDVQMRRRLFFQILPLDGASSRMAGVAVSIPDDWDTRQPLNIDDEQIWPTMTEAPVAREGATEMIFCLARSSLGTFIAKPGKSVDASKHLDDRAREWAIKEAEKEVEERYIRYCDFMQRSWRMPA
ncbi:Transcription factor vrtR1 like protein [Verticillium longisporum]|nr:Transcription factor vrtR1 like protein [Verticillium longisporum]